MVNFAMDTEPDRRSDEDGVSALPRGIASGFASLMVTLALGGALFVLMGLVGPLMVIILAVALSEFMRALRRRRAVVVLAYVAQAVRLNLPLPSMLAAAAGGERGAVRRKLVDLAASLYGGIPLDAALEQTVPEIPRRTTRLIASAQRLGRLREALDREIDRERRLRMEDAADRAYRRAYPALVLFSLIAIVSITIMRVVPKYAQIFHDFRIPLPPATRFLIEFPIELLAVIPVVLGAWLVARTSMDLLRAVAPRRLGKVWGVSDVLVWHTPVWGAIARDRDTADLMFLLADALAAGHSTDAALYEASEQQFNVMMGRRVAAMHRHAMSGATLPEAFRRAGFPDLVSGMLASARGKDGLVDALRFLGRHYTARHQRIVHVLQAAWVPFLSLLFGAAVGFIAVALFMPMVRLTRTLMPGGGVL